MLFITGFTPPCPSSSTQMPAVLVQVTPEGERVVAYHSRTFNNAGCCCCVTRQELLAVVSAIRHVKYTLGASTCPDRS